jgi:PhoPQ-activated pathogenicity-related protein
MPDSAQYYWSQLTGEKHLRIVPNAEHSLAGHIISVLDGALEFYKSLMNEETTRPTYSWTISADGGTITVTTSTTKGLVSAKAWMSNNTHARDWRLVTCAQKSPSCANPVFFKSVNLKESAPGVFSYTHAMPAVGWSAFFIELEYDINNDGDFMTVTSDMSIIPKKMPYPHCGVDVCYCGYQCPGLRNVAETRLVDGQ